MKRVKIIEKLKYKPRGLKLREAERLLNSIKEEADLSNRICLVSQQFIGRSYFDNPLGGGPQQEESFVCSLEGFDCVTYIETVFAFAMSDSVEEFVSKLRKIRYVDGRVEWSSRNHYMTDWAANNEAGGFVINITQGEGAVEKRRLLNVVAGLPAKSVTFSCYPKRRFARIADKICTGDIALFVSVRKRLDVFHTGFLIRRDAEILLRHATRKHGAVVEQRLEEFLAENRMSGLILVRPRYRKSKRASTSEPRSGAMNLARPFKAV